MKVVFLVLSFVAVIFLIRLFAVHLNEYLRGKRFHKKQEEKLSNIDELYETNHNTTNTNNVILTGTIDRHETQNLDSKYIGNVYRAKNGRFVSKKQLTNV